MDETVRVLAVKRFEHLNLQLGNELQDLIAMASEICDMPIALLTLLDEDTQWIKASIGTDVQTTPREVTFCTHAIQQEDIFIVPDALLDERFINNPLVTEHKIRSYAGAPLVTHDGIMLGTLCVIDQQPHALSTHQQGMLKMLSKQAINIMELKLSQELLEKNQREVELQRQTIKSAEIRLRSFFETSSNLHVLLGKNGEVLDFNKTAHNFIKSVHQINISRGDQLVTYMDPLFVEEFNEKYNMALTGEKCMATGETDYAGKGKIYWEAAFEPAWNNENEIIGISYLVRNITDRKIYEQKIVDQNTSLINIAYIQSHEYRGPLSSIMGMMGLIKQEDYQPPVEYLQLLEAAINNLDEKIHQVVSHVNYLQEKRF